MPEPFDPTPQAELEQAEQQLLLAAKRLRLAMQHLEAVDPVLERRVFEVHKSTTEIIHTVRS